MIRAWIVFDLGFGDSGKGTITDFLVRERGAGLVVRFNGGAQAGHNVVTPAGHHHTFSQFGAGTFVPGVLSHLGPAFVLHPGAMLVEAKKLESVGVADTFERTTIDGRALVVTPHQQAAGRLREVLRGDARHGTCGAGIGEAVSDSLAGHSDTVHAADIRNPSLLRETLASQRIRKRTEIGQHAAFAADPRAAPELAILDDGASGERVLFQWAPLFEKLRVVDSTEAQRILGAQRSIVFEGAQGMLLDETWGFHPHTTWSDCTPAGALAILDEAGFDGRVTRLGVIRAYSTRHGEGPFPTGSAEHAAAHRDPNNNAEGWQGEFRTGPLDLVLLRYAAEAAAGVDGVAVTCLDQVGKETDACVAYSVRGEPPEPAFAERDAGGMVRRLVPGPREDLSHRERLGTLLRRADPVLARFSREDLLKEVSKATGAPVLLESLGPNAGDKRWLRKL